MKRAKTFNGFKTLWVLHDFFSKINIQSSSLKSVFSLLSLFGGLVEDSKWKFFYLPEINKVFCEKVKFFPHWSIPGSLKSGMLS